MNLGRELEKLNEKFQDCLLYFSEEEFFEKIIFWQIRSHEEEIHSESSYLQLLDDFKGK